MIRVLFDIDKLRHELKEYFEKRNISKIVYVYWCERLDEMMRFIDSNNPQIEIDRYPNEEETNPQIFGRIIIDFHKIEFRCIYLNSSWKLVYISQKEFMTLKDLIFIRCYEVYNPRKKFNKFEFLKNIFNTR